MRLATVIGRVTLSVRHPKLKGERLLLALPWIPETFSKPEQTSFSIVAYDELGADVGQTIAISEGREAACPFDPPIPIDAYCAALVDTYFYQEQEPQ
ncbi:MAG: EutN/CcmL family microcompartment protein [Candidatus Methylacidiphilales bacterium]